MEFLLTEYDIFQHIHQHQLVNNNPASLYSSLETMYDVELSKADKSNLKMTFLKFTTYRKRVHSKREAFDWDAIVGKGSDEIDVMKVIIPEEMTVVVPDEKESLEDSFKAELSSGYKPFKDLNRKQKLRRINPLVKLLNVMVKYYQTTEEELLEVLNYSKGKQMKGTIPLITALTLYQECELGRRRYTKQKKLLKAAGFDVLPSYKKLDHFKKTRVPEIHFLPAPYIGVCVNLEEAVTMSMKRLEDSGQVKILNNSQLSLKYGFDGSGSHNIFNQKGNAETSNILLSTFCPLSLEHNNTNLWKETTPNSATAQKPYCLQMGKESVDQYHAQDPFQDELLKMEQGIDVNKKTVTVKAHLSCDRKASEMVFGNAGAFCDMCTLTKEECEDVNNIKNGFVISKSVEGLWEVYENLKDPDDENEIVKRRGDYDERQGQCHKPTIRHETNSYQVLHARLRTFDTFMEAMVRSYAGMEYWGVGGPHTKTLHKNFKAKLQEYILTTTHIHWDYPNQQGGTSTTGKIAQDLLEKYLDVIIVVLKETDKQKFKFFGSQLAGILRVINSKDFVNVDHYHSICTSLNVFLRESLPWVSITPTMHKLLGHTWELIELNGDKGLGVFDESGLEACNKLLRKFRIQLGRKTSQMDNLIDTFIRFWLNSDEEVNQQRKKTLPWCKNCSIRGHSTRYCPLRNTTEGPLNEVDTLVKYMKSN